MVALNKQSATVRAAPICQLFAAAAVRERYLQIRRVEHGIIKPANSEKKIDIKDGMIAKRSFFIVL